MTTFTSSLPESLLQQLQDKEPNAADKISEVMSSINIPLIIGMFIFYFLGEFIGRFFASKNLSKKRTSTQ